MMSNMTELPVNGSMLTNTTDAAFPNDTTSAVTTAAPSSSGGGASFIPWANEYNIMTKQQSDDITFALQCVVFPILTVFGVTGNILSLIVMFQRRLRRSTTSIILIGLAFSDTLVLTTNMIRKSTCIIKQYDPLASDSFNAKSFRYIYYMKLGFGRVSTLIVMVISIERLIAVAFPLQVRSLMTRTRVIIAVIACYVIAFVALIGIPLQYTYTVIRGRPYIAQTPFALENVDSLKIYNERFLPIAFRYIPVLVVLFLNIAIISLISRSRKIQKASTKKDASEEQKKITRLLLSVALIYLICLIPGDVLLLTSDLVEGFNFFGFYHNLFLVLSDFSNLFEIFNSSINFILYMVFNRNFYETYMKLFCGFAGKLRARAYSSRTSGSSQKTEGTSANSIQPDNDKIAAIKMEQSSGYEGSKVEEEDDVNDVGNTNPAFVQE